MGRFGYRGAPLQLAAALAPCASLTRSKRNGTGEEPSSSAATSSFLRAGAGALLQRGALLSPRNSLTGTESQWDVNWVVLAAWFGVSPPLPLP